nr:MAG TPA: hypothetical protein [Caudoviricetes sp.]
MMFSKYGEFKGYDWDKRLYASRYCFKENQVIFRGRVL